MMTRINVSMSSGNANLNTISGGRDGDVIILSTVNVGGTLTVKDGTGNIECGTDFAMVTVLDRMTLMYDGSISKWVQLARSTN